MSSLLKFSPHDLAWTRHYARTLGIAVIFSLCAEGMRFHESCCDFSMLLIVTQPQTGTMSRLSCRLLPSSLHLGVLTLLLWRNVFILWMLVKLSSNIPSSTSSSCALEIISFLFAFQHSIFKSLVIIRQGIAFVFRVHAFTHCLWPSYPKSVIVSGRACMRMVLLVIVSIPPQSSPSSVLSL